MDESELDQVCNAHLIIWRDALMLFRFARLVSSSSSLRAEVVVVAAAAA